MSENVKVPYGKGGDNATLLLDAAEKLDLSPGVVRTTIDGFEVPKEVADKAGVDTYDPDEEFAKEVAKAQSEIEDSTEVRGNDMTLSRSGYDEQEANSTAQPAEKAPAKKAAAKAPAKKTTAKKAAAKKTAAKKSTSKGA